MLSNKTLIGLFAGVFVCAAGCGGPSKPGDGCNIDDDNCPDALVCGAFEGNNVCLIAAGGACDPKAEKAYCSDDGTCEVPADGGAEVCIRHIAEGGVCDPENSKFEVCDDGLTCAELKAGGHKCYPPVVFKGRVFDSATDKGIPSADVIALDEVAAAVTDVAVSDMSGIY